MERRTEARFIFIEDFKPRETGAIELRMHIVLNSRRRLAFIH
jgi:hypothetical protein